MHAVLRAVVWSAAGVAAVAAAIVLYLAYTFARAYLRSRSLSNIPSPPVPSLILGHIPELSSRQSWKTWASYAETYGSTFFVQSLFGSRFMVSHDPKLLHTIMVKDQDIWPKSLDPSDTFTLLLGPGVLAANGPQHKRQRKLLTPVFSVAHLRNMTHIFYRVAHKAREAITDRLPSDGTFAEIDVNGWMARTTLEMLGQAGLGYSFDDFKADSTDDYGESLKGFFPSLTRADYMELIIHWGSRFAPESAIRALLRILPVESFKEVMRISDTMTRRSEEIVRGKKAALAKGDTELTHEIGEGKDIMSICLRANMAAADNEKMTDAELLAQMSTFILAGMDTTSNALSRILHLLAQHTDVQQKLRAEIVEAQGGEHTDISYDDVIKLPYMDAVCRETLRLYAPVMLSSRIASKDTVLPLLNPIRGRDGREITEIPIKRGTPVGVHYQASNVEKEMWGEDALEWKPERWLSPLPASLEEARIPGVYAHLMTFAAGSRSCIGFKFSQLEMKVVLAVLLPRFAFEVTDKPVAWNSSAVMYPTMGEESTKPELVLKVKTISA